MKILIAILLIPFVASSQPYDTVWFNFTPTITYVLKPLSPATQTKFLSYTRFTDSTTGVIQTATRLKIKTDSLADALAITNAALLALKSNIADTATMLNPYPRKASPTFTGTVSGITATMVGLGNVTNESKATMFTSPAFTGTPTGITAAHVGLGNVTNESKATMFASPTFTGTVTLPASTSFTTPVIGAATGTSLAVTGAITSSGAGIGYTSGNGGTVMQITNKSTTVVLNKLAGDITMINSALAAAAIVSFTLTNNQIAATDIIHVQHNATGTFGAYTITGRSAAGSAVISVRNNTAGSLSEAIVIKFIIIKSVIN